MTNILFVDDDHDFANVMKMMLELRDEQQVTIAHSAEIGYEKVLFLIPDVVIVDMTLPRMQGVEFVAKLRNTSAVSHIAIVGMSADDKFKADHQELGMDAFLLKPFDFSNLQDAIIAALSFRFG